MRSCLLRFLASSCIELRSLVLSQQDNRQRLGQISCRGMEGPGRIPSEFIATCGRVCNHSGQRMYQGPVSVGLHQSQLEDFTF